ncbi:hypothetical protein H6F50_22355 [Coleofasciculus sp. FACHB-712]|uniref:hypothetical protein n=1 Tax=Coleofasciculus sp. FACHB-712 TaxID=2692789 RepID=UPI001685A045|nr:hypothetical protein [Coleofasciculus sp. FACHB-712]MBD1945060.1 hypothetical protein [Coleofasciculus sp. FACHB-712]
MQFASTLRMMTSLHNSVALLLALQGALNYIIWQTLSISRVTGMATIAIAPQK